MYVVYVLATVGPNHVQANTCTISCEQTSSALQHLKLTVSSSADGTNEANPSHELPSRLQAVTPEDSFTSASGFYSPRSHMASRQQSASSSDAWFDAHSQMVSRASSVSTPGSSAALPSAGTAVEMILHALKHTKHCLGP